MMHALTRLDSAAGHAGSCFDPDDVSGFCCAQQAQHDNGTVCHPELVEGSVEWLSKGQHAQHRKTDSTFLSVKD